MLWDVVKKRYSHMLYTFLKSSLYIEFSQIPIHVNLCFYAIKRCCLIILNKVSFTDLKKKIKNEWITRWVNKWLNIDINRTFGLLLLLEIGEHLEHKGYSRTHGVCKRLEDGVYGCPSLLLMRQLWKYSSCQTVFETLMLLQQTPIASTTIICHMVGHWSMHMYTVDRPSSFDIQLKSLHDAPIFPTCLHDLLFNTRISHILFPFTPQ